MMYSVKEIREKTKVERKLLIRLIDIPADYLTWALQNAPISPNIITILRILLQGLFCLLLLKGTYPYLIIGTILFQTTMVLDCVDGKLARIRSQYSLNGTVMDHIGHHYANTLFLLCYSIGVAKIYQTMLWAHISICIIILMLLEKSIRINPWWFFDKQEAKTINELFGPYQKSKRIFDIESFFRIENPLGMIFFGTIFHLSEWLLILYLGLYTFNLVYTTKKQIKKISTYEKKMRKLQEKKHYNNPN